VSLTELDNYVTCAVRHIKTTFVGESSPFSWYLREELLEIQVWLTSQKITDAEKAGEETRPRNRDKLIGSAYLGLSSLAAVRRTHRVGGVYPLFKPGTSGLGGACLMAHVELKSSTAQYHNGEYDENNADESFVRDQSVLESPGKRSTHRGDGSSRKFDMEKVFAVHISIERAFHLPMVLHNGTGVKPSCYVSYQTAESSDLTHTQIVCDTNDPVWCHEHDTHLGRHLLAAQQQHVNLVFKVWHKPQDVEQVPDKTVDKVLGFVSVDLSPLTTGSIPHLCGFYNIIDFNGLCQGQIKVSIVPTESAGVRQGSGLGPHAVHTLASSTAFIPANMTWYPDAARSQSELGQSDSLPRYTEHMESVRRHHNQLHQRMLEMGVDDPSEVSRSMLFTTLR